MQETESHISNIDQNSKHICIFNCNRVVRGMQGLPSPEKHHHSPYKTIDHKPFLLSITLSWLKELSKYLNLFLVILQKNICKHSSF